jgi:hypothetical protein
VDDTGRVALWLACHVLAMVVSITELYRRTPLEENFWTVDGVVDTVAGWYPSFTELQDLRANWRFRMSHIASDDRKLPIDIAARARAP